MKSLIFALAIVLAGCTQEPEWVSAPMQYRCTMEQAKQVDFETRTCDSTGGWNGFGGQYCYGTALMRNCAKEVGGVVLPNTKANVAVKPRSEAESA